MDPGSPMEKKDKDLEPLFEDFVEFTSSTNEGGLYNDDSDYGALINANESDPGLVPVGHQMDNDQQFAIPFFDSEEDEIQEMEETESENTFEEEDIKKITALIEMPDLEDIQEIINMDFILNSIANPNESITQDITPVIGVPDGISYTHRHKMGKHGEYQNFGYYPDPLIRIAEDFILLFRKFNELTFYLPSSTPIGDVSAKIDNFHFRDNENHTVHVRECAINRREDENELVIHLENNIPPNNNSNNNNLNVEKKKGRGSGVHPNVFLLRLIDEIGVLATFYIFAYKRTRGIHAGVKKAKEYIANLFKPNVS